MGALPPEEDQLLYRVRVAAAAAAVGLFAIVVLLDRNPTTVGLVAGAMFVLLGLVSAERMSRK